MYAYPAGFTAVVDPTLKVPYTANDSWADSTYTVTHAAERGRFDGIRRVWAVEDDIDGVQDSYGLSELERLGFEETGLRVQTHRTVIIEYSR
jgi:mannosyltransferase